METIEKTSFDRIYSFKVVLTVLKEGSFTAAANRLGTTPPNITKEIQKLEKSLGIEIFHRTTRSLSLSEKGQIALNKARHIVEIVSELEEEIKEDTETLKGSIRITAPKTLGKTKVSKIITNFQILHPELEIDLRLSDKILDPITNGIDLSIRTAFELGDSSQYVRHLGTLERVICASPEYIKNAKALTQLKSLENHNCLNYMRGQSPFPWTFSKKDEVKKVNTKGTFSSNNLLTLLEACKKGIGIVNAPKYLVEEDVMNGDLVELFKTWDLPGHNVYILTTMKPSTSRKLTELSNFIAEHIGDKF